MGESLELLVVMLAVGSPVIIIVFINRYFKYRTDMTARMTELKNQIDASSSDQLTRDVARLTERINVLESIVTERGYRIDAEIRSLGD